MTKYSLEAQTGTAWVLKEREITESDGGKDRDTPMERLKEDVRARVCIYLCMCVSARA